MVRHFKLGARIFAIMAAVAMTLMITTPANATTGNIGSVAVTNSAGTTIDLASGDTGFTAANSGAVSATIAGFGTFGCSGATAAGTLHAGSGSSGAKDPYLTFTSLDITGCASPAGVTVDVHLLCNVGISANPNPGQTVDSAASDTNVTGSMNAGAAGSPCVQAKDPGTNGALCTLGVSGQTSAALNESTQELTVSGSGLSVDGVSGLCVLAGLNGAAVSFTLPLALSLDSYPGEKINFIP